MLAIYACVWQVECSRSDADLTRRQDQRNSETMSEWETAGRKTRTTTRTAPRPAVKPDQVLNQARRQGIPVETQQKYGGGSNKQQAGAKNTAKLDRETEELKHDQVPLELGKLIMRARYLHLYLYHTSYYSTRLSLLPLINLLVVSLNRIYGFNRQLRVIVFTVLLKYSKFNVGIQ